MKNHHEQLEVPKNKQKKHRQKPGAQGLQKMFIDMRVFPKIKVPQNGWFIMETPIKMDDLWVPLFLETPICLGYP